MAIDRESKYTVTFEGEAGTLGAVLSAFKSQVKRDSKEIEAAATVELFKGALDATVKLQAELDTLRQRATFFRLEIARVNAEGEKVPKALTQGLKAVEKQIAATSREYNKQSDNVTRLSATLAKAGIDVNNLAAEEKKLAAAIEAVNRAAAQQASKDLLGFKSLRDVAPEIARVRAAFDQLKATGNLSFGELSSATARMNQEINKLRASTSGIGAAFGQLRGQVLAIAGVLTGVTLAVTGSARAYREFAQQVALINSISNVNQKELDAMADRVRELARVMGVDAVESAKALYQIISSGVEAPATALAILEASTRAAVAGMTSVATAARAGVAVLNAFGLQAGEINGVFDVLFKTVQDGVVSFEDLANNLGEVIPTARSANVSLQEVAASFVVLTRSGINASESATAIRSAILALSAPAPEAAEKLRDLSVELNGFVGVIEQLSARDLSLNVIRQLVPDVRAAKAVQILTQNFRLLRDEIGEMAKAAGAAEAAYGKLANTPQARIDRFNASVKDLAISFGEFVSSGDGIVTTMTGLINGFNTLDAGTRKAAIEFAAFAAALTGAAVILRTLSIPLNLFVGAITQAVPALARLSLGLDASAIAMRGLAAATALFLGYEIGKWARENVPFVSSFGDLLGTALAAGAQSAGLALDGLVAVLTLNGKALVETRERGKRFTEFMRQEFSEILSGARERLRELTGEQARLREELGKATAAAAAAAAGIGTAFGPIATNVRTLLTGIDQQMAAFEQRLTALVAKLGESVAATQSLTAAAIGNVNARVAAELASLDTLRLNEVEKVRQSTEIQRQAAAERLAIINRFAGDAIRAFEAEATARLELAKRTGENLQKLEADTNNKRRILLQGIVEQYRAHLASLVALEAGHLEKIKGIQEQRRLLNASIEDKLRELRRGTLTLSEQYADRLLEIDTLNSRARQALAKGDNKLAEELANKALNLTANIAQKVEDGERLIVSGYDAAKNAADRYQASSAILNTSLNQREAAEQAGAEAAKKAADQTIGKINAVESEVDKLQEKAAKGIELAISVDQQALEEIVRKLDEAIEQRERLVRINGDITGVQLEIERLKSDLDRGITVNVEARTDKITEALLKIQADAPEITADVAPALAAIEKVRLAAKEVERVRVQVESNAEEIAKVLDGINGKTYRAKLIIDVERRGDALPPGEALPTGQGFARGGPVQAPARGFAAGGGVFRTPRWSKVPGSGSGDTVPAALPVGSFVLRKRAVGKYGAGNLLRSLIGAPFANGGFAFAEKFFRSVRGMTNILRQSRSGGSAEGPKLGRDPALSDIVSKAYRVFNPLIDAAKVLPRSKNGQNLVDYLSRVLDLIINSLSAEEAGPLLDSIASIAGNLMASIRTANQYRVPIVMGMFSGDAPDDSTSPSDLYRQLQDTMRRGRFTGGGAIGKDTVPAWLTPGEVVIQPDAVKAARARFGENVFHLLNEMKMPSAAFRPPRVQRFAEGGDVQPSASSSAAGSGLPFGQTAQNVFNLMDPRIDEAFVLRYIVPHLNRLEKKSR